MAPAEARRRAGASRRALVLYPPGREVCGVGVAVATLAEALGSRGWEVVVGLAQGHRFHDPGFFQRRFPRVATVLCDGRTGSEEGRVHGIAQAVSRVRPDVVVQTLMHDAFEAVRRLRCRGATFPLVTANHSSHPAHAADIIENRDVIDAIVCVNRLPALAIAAVEPSLAPERIRVIPNVVPEPTCEPARAGRVVRIGHAGRLEPDKRFGDLLLLAERLLAARGDLEFWVAGAGSLAGDMARFAAAHPGRVRFFGALLREDLYREFYPHLDLYAHFSASEGWSTSLGEAMVHRVVPVTSSFAGIRAEGLLQDDVNAAFFPVGDVAAAARRIEGLCREPGLRAALGEAARTAIRSGFTLERYAADWAGALEEAILRRRSGGLAPQLRAPLSNRSESVRETLRRLMRRRFVHASVGEEWPPMRGRDPLLIGRLEAAMADIERAPAGTGSASGAVAGPVRATATFRSSR